MGKYFILESLEKLFGTFRLGPVSLNLEEKDYLVLLGTTGCGKTSLLRSIVGIRGKIKNSIFLDGRDIGILPPQKRHIGYVAQAGDLFPHLSVRKNIVFGLAYQNITAKEKQRRRDRYLDLFDLVKQANQPVATLSGGENKRTAMARSLIVEPKILLLDEPLGMLDQNGRKAMLGTLKMIHDELQTTTIHVTHDRHEAWRIAKQCAVMDSGRIIQTGTVAELVRKPKTRFVAEFLGGTNIFQATFDGIHARLEWTDLTLSAPVAYSKGWVLIRPELISIDRENSKCKLSGVVEAIHDFGEYIEVDVAASDTFDSEQPGSVELKVHMPLAGAQRIEEGQQVFLDWKDESLHTFSEI
jgi:ABC-type Fe3+/spermidine/putrescine transport system ATPase subunit